MRWRPASALGQTGAEASTLWHRAAFRIGMLSIIDSAKVVGLVALPGCMTGMRWPVPYPAAAIRFQLVIM